jgi:hypothetical protein
VNPRALAANARGVQNLITAENNRDELGRLRFSTLELPGKL